MHDAPDVVRLGDRPHVASSRSPRTLSAGPARGLLLVRRAGVGRRTPPIHIESVTFAGGAPPTGWAVVSDYGGKAEITDPSETGSTCSGYGGPFCIYPWFTLNNDGSFTYGVDYPTTVDDFGRADQFEQTTAVRRPVRPEQHLLRHPRSSESDLLESATTAAGHPATQRCP